MARQIGTRLRREWNERPLSKRHRGAKMLFPQKRGYLYTNQGVIHFLKTVIWHRAGNFPHVQR